MQEKLNDEELRTKPNLTKEYSKGSYNKFDDEEQHIRISDGCPNGCEYCAESSENGTKPIYYDIPEIVRNKVKILDMNLIYKPNALEIIKFLGKQKAYSRVVYYELICGIDYRYMTQEIADALKVNRFKNIRLAWDHSVHRQKDIKKVIDMLYKAGFKHNEITVFIICNWKITYIDCLFKMDLCKVWRVKIADCWFDNQLSPNIKPIHWTIEHIKDFRRRVRKHNQIVLFGIDPELK